MARMFKPVTPGPSNNKKTEPNEQNGGNPGAGAETAPKPGQTGFQGLIVWGDG